MPPTANHCGIVSIKMRPAMAIIFFDAGLWSSIPYISAFSRDGAALITFGIMTSPSAEECEAWRSRSVERRRVAGIELLVLAEESVLRFLAIHSTSRGLHERKLGIQTRAWSSSAIGAVKNGRRSDTLPDDFMPRRYSVERRSVNLLIC